MARNAERQHFHPHVLLLTRACVWRGGCGSCYVDSQKHNYSRPMGLTHARTDRAHKNRTLIGDENAVHASNIREGLG